MHAHVNDSIRSTGGYRGGKVNNALKQKHIVLDCDEMERRKEMALRESHARYNHIGW